MSDKIISWNNAEVKKPKDGQKIIFYDNIGMFKGLYRNRKNGQVLVNSTETDIVEWDDVSEWIIYPKH